MMLSILSCRNTIKNEITADIKNVMHTPVRSNVVVCILLPIDAMR